MATGMLMDSQHGLDKVVLRNKEGDEATIYLYGGHVTSLRLNQKDLIFVSQKAVFKPPKAIRGGIPICFPQFSDIGQIKTSHGFARNSTFDIYELNEDSCAMVFRLTQDQIQQIGDLELKVTYSLNTHGQFKQELKITNHDQKSIQLTVALHSYYKVADITKVEVQGTKNQEYLDNVNNRQKCKDSSSSITFNQEVDRIYLNIGEIKIIDGSNGNIIRIQKQNMPDVVVWNPWTEKSKSIGDLDNNEYKEFVCVEPCVAGSKVLSVNAQETWIGSQIISVS